MKWVSSFQAVKQLRAAGIDELMTLAIWAEKKSVKARAAAAERDGEDVCVPALSDTARRDGVLWPDIPPEFWHWLQKNGTPHWEVGSFVASVIEEMEGPEGGVHHHWKLSDVTFNAADLTKMIRTLHLVRRKKPTNPAVNRGDLQEWWDRFPDKTAIAEVIQEAAEAAFPKNNVPRKLLRIIRGKRMAGRRKNPP